MRMPPATPQLHDAAARNKTAAINVLVEAGAELDAHGNGWTPLYEASSEGCCEPLVISGDTFSTLCLVLKSASAVRRALVELTRPFSAGR